MNYPEEMVAPMRRELTEVGFKELKTPTDVDEALHFEGTSLLVINSVCGCSAAAARPGVKWAIANSIKKPGQLLTVFAGMELDAVAKAREYTKPYPPSSPCIGFFKNGKLIDIIERRDIQNNDEKSLGMIIKNLLEAHN